MRTQRTIVVVESNPITRKTLRRALVAEGLHVLEAGGAETALAHVASLVPDLALIEAALPDLDGRELATRLRAATSTRFPIIALAGAFEDAASLLARADPFDEVLVKPVDVARLAASVFAVLETRDAEDLPGAGRRVLLVAAQGAQRDLDRAKLARLGFQVALAATAAEVDVELTRAGFDAVLVDALLRGDDAFAVSADAARHAPVVLVTLRQLEARHRELALRAGANDVVVREARVEELASVVMRAIEAGPRPRQGSGDRAGAQAAALSVLRAISDAMPDPDRVPGAALERAAEVMQLSAAYLYTHESGRLSLRGRVGPAEGAADLFGHAELFELAMRERRAVALPGDGDIAALDLLSRARLAASGLIVPLSRGALLLLSASASLGRPEWQEAAEAIAAHLSRALELSPVTPPRRPEHILRFARAAAGATDLGELAKVAVRDVAVQLGVEQVAVLEARGEEERFTVVAAHGWPDGPAPRATRVAQAGLTLETGETIVVPDAAAERGLSIPEGDGARGAITAAIDGARVLAVCSRVARRLGRDEGAYVTAIAELLGAVAQRTSPVAPRPRGDPRRHVGEQRSERAADDLEGPDRSS